MTCVTNVIGGPTTVTVNTNGTPLSLTTSLTHFSFSGGTVVVWATPVCTLARTVTYGRPLSAGVTVMAGIPPAGAPCTVTGFGASLGMTIPGPTADATTTTTPTITTSASPTMGTWSVVPSVSGKPNCVAAGNTSSRSMCRGRTSIPLRRSSTAYIYYVDHYTFMTMYNGYDSRIAATMQSVGPTFLQGVVKLQDVHNAGHDPYGPGGNHYVQIQNGDGKLDARAPNYFTVQPYTGGDSHCH